MKFLPTGRAWQFAPRLVAAYLALIVLMLAFPSAFPALVRPLLVPAVARLDADYTVLGARVVGPNVVLQLEGRKLQRFHDQHGVPGPVVRFESFRSLQGMTVYPLVALALVAAWPVGWRRVLIMAAVALALCVVVAAIDTGILALWSGAETCAERWAAMRGAIPSTLDNAEAHAALQADIRRLTVAKSFLSAGGRPFVGLVIFLLALAVVQERRQAPAA